MCSHKLPINTNTKYEAVFVVVSAARGQYFIFIHLKTADANNQNG